MISTRFEGLFRARGFAPFGEMVWGDFMRHLLIGALAALGLLAAGPAAAQSCGLSKVASYAMQQLEDGRVVITMKIGDTDTLMQVDTGAWFSILNADTVHAMHLPHQEHSDQFAVYDAYGHKTSEVATAPSIDIGPLKVTSVDFIVASHRTNFGKGVAGLLGANVLKHFDVDFDFANKTFNIFLQDHCPGKVVYWTAGGSAQIPFKFNGSNITVPVTLDGHELYALLDSGAFASTISEPTANRMFNVAPGGGDVIEKDYTRDDGSKDTDYSHVFGTLSFKGVTIANPLLHLIPDKMGQAVDSDNARRDYTQMPGPHIPELLLGIAELKHLHLYIAYQEKMLYVTSADAH